MTPEYVRWRLGGMHFDPDALLAALPKREIEPILPGPRRTTVRTPPKTSALDESGAYNGFTGVERNRTAELSKRLERAGATVRPDTCSICGNAAQDEHAENYYDLSRWIGLCMRCHRHTLHRRFSNPRKWFALLDAHELPGTHWARLVCLEPFDLAQLLRSRGEREPTASDFAKTL